MAKKDYYEILGVPQNASKDQINKAYKALALKYHPDRHKDNPKAAEEKFKTVTEAYQVLSDPKKRAAYDQFGHEGLRGTGTGPAGGGFGFSSDIFGDIFGDLFGMGSGRDRSQTIRGQDLKINVRISFLDAVFGAEKTIRVPRDQTCGRCSGNGVEPGYQPTTCPRCHGSGQTTFHQGFFTLSRTCDQCRGEGIVIEKVCSQCRGRGTTQTYSNLNIKIPPGINTGQRLKLSGEGSAGPRGAQAGNLYVEIEVQRHEFFERDGDDIHIEVPISFALATTGGEIEVPTLHGNIKMKIPLGTQSGRRFRLKNKGVPHVEGHQFGDQIVHIVVETPSHLSRQQKELLEAFQNTLTEKNAPLKEAYLNKLSHLAQK